MKRKHISCFKAILCLDFSTKRHLGLLTIDLVAAFVLFIVMLALLYFLCCYHFSVNKELYKTF